MVGTSGHSLQPASMPPLPLSHSQSGLATSASASYSSATTSSVHTPTMTAMPKPTQEPGIPMDAVMLAPLSASAMDAAPAAMSTSEDPKPLKKTHSKKKKKRSSMSESTPLILKGNIKSSEEEVHPLPWFRSPEWPRKASPLNTNDKRRKSSNRFRRGRTNREQTSLCNAIMSKVCCGLVASESDADLELGSALRSDREEMETEGFKYCVQFLVGLIVIVAAGLIVMIIFQPFQDDASLW